MSFDRLKRYIGWVKEKVVEKSGEDTEKTELEDGNNQGEVHIDPLSFYPEGFDFGITLIKRDMNVTKTEKIEPKVETKREPSDIIAVK